MSNSLERQDLYFSSHLVMESHPISTFFKWTKIMKIQFLIDSLLTKLFHVPVVPTFCFYQNLSNHSLPPPTCLSDHILAATNDRHLRAIHGGHRNIGALYLGFLYGFLHFLSEENQEKTAAVAGWEVKFDSVCFISPVSSWWQNCNFSGVWILLFFFGGGEFENIQELWIWSLVQRAKVPTQPAPEQKVPPLYQPDHWIWKITNLEALRKK